MVVVVFGLSLRKESILFEGEVILKIAFPSHELAYFPMK